LFFAHLSGQKPAEKMNQSPENGVKEPGIIET
jgi:hypothetical protein